MAVKVTNQNASTNSDLPSDITITGHAIVSENGMIADADGNMPAGLIVDEDQQAFQSALDASSLVVLGRKGHERHPSKGRRRLVATRSVPAFEPDPNCADAYFWNPQSFGFASVLDRLKINSGVIAITGGQNVFDLFLPIYDNFCLTQVQGFRLEPGISCFANGDPHSILRDAGLMQNYTPIVISTDHIGAHDIVTHQYEKPLPTST